MLLLRAISASFTVISSSFLRAMWDKFYLRQKRAYVAPSWATDGRMHAGGTERYCHINSSGRPWSGRSPNSSQSYKISSSSQPTAPIWTMHSSHTSADILLNRSSTFNGFKSSCALPNSPEICFSCSIAFLKVSFHFSISGAVFFALNFSWMILSRPPFFTTPFMLPQ